MPHKPYEDYNYSVDIEKYNRCTKCGRKQYLGYYTYYTDSRRDYEEKLKTGEYYEDYVCDECRYKAERKEKDKKKSFWIVGGIVVAVILFLVFVAPHISNWITNVVKDKMESISNKYEQFLDGWEDASSQTVDVSQTKKQIGNTLENSASYIANHYEDKTTVAQKYQYNGQYYWLIDYKSTQNKDMSGKKYVVSYDELIYQIDGNKSETITSANADYQKIYDALANYIPEKIIEGASFEKGELKTNDNGSCYVLTGSISVAMSGETIFLERNNVASKITIYTSSEATDPIFDLGSVIS